MEWVKWALEQPSPKPSWLSPWKELTEPEREVDRRIGEAVANVCLIPHQPILACLDTNGFPMCPWVKDRITADAEWINELQRYLDGAHIRAERAEADLAACREVLRELCDMSDKVGTHRWIAAVKAARQLLAEGKA